jgi:hypothetical protein
MLEEEFNSPPIQLRLRLPNAVLLGRASKEQQTIATLFGQVSAEHQQMHAAENMPMGINPRVNFDHYRNHVMMLILLELLIWSAHRDYPDISETMSIGAIQIDDDWNMYAIPKGAS